MVKVKRANFKEELLNPQANLPYGLTPGQVGGAIRRLYDYFYDHAVFAVTSGYLRIEALLLGNALSGVVSEIFVKNVDEVCPTLRRNRKVGGFPDLLPAGEYPEDSVLRRRLTGSNTELKHLVWLAQESTADDALVAVQFQLLIGSSLLALAQCLDEEE